MSVHLVKTCFSFGAFHVYIVVQFILLNPELNQCFRIFHISSEAEPLIQFVARNLVKSTSDAESSQSITDDFPVQLKFA